MRCEVGWDARRGVEEITIGFEDVKVGGVAFVEGRDVSSVGLGVGMGSVHYARPFVDDAPRELIIEVGGECMVLDLKTGQASFTGPAKARIIRLLGAITDKVNGVTNVCRVEQFTFRLRNSESHVTLDEVVGEIEQTSGQRTATTTTTTTATQTSVFVRGQEAISKKRKLDSDASSNPHAETSADAEPESITWTVRTGQWIITAQQQQQQPSQSQRDEAKRQMEIVLVGVKVDVYTNERARNARRGFLG